ALLDFLSLDLHSVGDFNGEEIAAASTRLAAGFDLGVIDPPFLDGAGNRRPTRRLAIVLPLAPTRHHGGDTTPTKAETHEDDEDLGKPVDAAGVLLSAHGAAIF